MFAMSKSGLVFSVIGHACHGRSSDGALEKRRRYDFSQTEPDQKSEVSDVSTQIECSLCSNGVND
jgi:hypothetical protein